MVTVSVTLRSRTAAEPPFTVPGTVPYEGCPLVVTREWLWKANAWTEQKGYVISHVPTGYQLSGFIWSTEKAALAVLLRCDPAFPAWPLANGDPKQSANQACHVKWTLATAGEK